MLRAVANIPEYIGSFTFANLPSASAYSGYRAFCSDLGANGTDVRSNGTRWRPVNGQAMLKSLGAAVSGVANAGTIVLQTLLPVNAWQVNDTLRLGFSLTKSGSTDTCIVNCYAGTAGTTADTPILGGLTFLAASNLTGGFILDFKLASATSVQRTGTQGAVPAFLGGSNSAITAPVTITDASANALYVSLTIQSGGTTNTVAIQSGQIQLLTP